jgi:nitrous oxidase accessory protein
MRFPRCSGVLGPAAIAAGLTLAPVIAAAAVLTAPPGQALQLTVDAAPTGSEVRVPAGHYPGSVTLRRPVSLIGEAGSVIDGEETGNVITIDAPDVVVVGLTIRNSGISLAHENSGVFVTKSGDRARIEENRFEHNLIGIDLKGPDHALVRRNTIIGRDDLRMNERGDGIHMWNSPGSIIEENSVLGGRDGIFVTTSRDNRFLNNRFRGLRFAIHYMYTNDSQVTGNISRGNHIGYALMYSDNLLIRGNVSEGDRDHGIMLNYTNHSRIVGNIVRPAPEKCVFIYNANFNHILDNRFEGCGIGIHFTAGSEDNEIAGNAFIDSRNQVKYVGTRLVDWTSKGPGKARGNYWSDAVVYDLDGDGIADQPYRPNGLTDQLIWRYPLARLLLNSPALHVLRWAQSRFPTLHPGGVIDRAPLMAPPGS